MGLITGEMLLHAIRREARRRPLISLIDSKGPSCAEIDGIFDLDRVSADLNLQAAQVESPTDLPRETVTHIGE